MRLNRDQLVRDGGLVALTNAVCVSVFLLVDSGTPARTSLDIGDEATFSGLDWSCEHVRQDRVKADGRTIMLPQTAICERASTPKGPRVVVSSDWITVARCNGPQESSISGCRTLLRVRRSP
jgi:hypothetical protein